MIDWNEEFTERVVGFNSTPRFVELKFSEHAAIFALPIAREDFVQQMTSIARAFKSDTLVTVHVKGQEVLSVVGAQSLEQR